MNTSDKLNPFGAADLASPVVLPQILARSGEGL